MRNPEKKLQLFRGNLKSQTQAGVSGSTEMDFCIRDSTGSLHYGGRKSVLTKKNSFACVKTRHTCITQQADIRVIAKLHANLCVQNCKIAKRQ